MSPTYELDHVFVCVDVDAPKADLIVSFGLSESEASVHPSQGTANRRFFFHNAYLPGSIVIHIAEGAPLSEPFWFFLESGRRPAAVGKRRTRWESHAIGFRDVAHLRTTGPLGDNPSAAAVAVSGTSAVTLGPWTRVLGGNHIRRGKQSSAGCI